MAKKDEDKAKIIVLKKFKDSETGKIYEKGADVSHLSEERIAKIKERGFIK